MNPIMKKDRGAALGLVLIFITILGVWIGAILLVTQVTTSGNAVLAKQSAQSSDVAKATAAAIAQLKHDLSAGLPAAGVQTNCNLPTTSVTTVTVTCTPIAVTNGATPGAVITTATTGTTPGVDFGTQITGPFTFDNTVQTLSSSLIVDPAASLNQAGCNPNCSTAGSVTPSAPALTGVVGTPYVSSISVTGGTAPYAFTKSGSLPGGLTLNATTGAITGTPTTAGSFTLTVIVTDNDLLTGSTTFTIVVTAPTAADVVTVTKPSELSTIGQCYSSKVSASGGVAPYTFSITSGSLPSGLTMSSSGQISGTPSGAGTSVTVSARDANGVTGTATFNIAVAAATQTLSLTTPTKGLDAIVNQPYSLNVSAIGGVGSLTFSADNLPAGLTMSSGGWIHGTPTVTTNATTIAIHVSDSGTPVATRDASFVFTSSAPSWTDGLSLTASVLKVKANTNFSLVLPLISGWGTNTFTATSSKPSWAKLDASTGVISYSPTSSVSSTGTYSFNVTVTDDKGMQATASATITVTSSGTSSNLALSQPSTTTGMVGEWFQAGYGITGGTTVSSFVVYSGSLPSGLNLNKTTGVINGVPTSSGTFNTTIKVTDSTPSTSIKSFSFTISAAASSLAISTPTSGISGNAGQYFQSETASLGGTGTLTYSLGSGSLPSSLTVDPSTGSISGTPALSASTNTYTGLTLRVTDGTTTRTTSSFTISIVGVTSTLAIVTPVDGLSGTAGRAYQLGIASTGGSCSSKSYTLTAGTLPAGVTLSSSSGTISGTLTSMTNATYVGLVVKVTDSSVSPSATASTSPFTITVTFNNNLTITSPPAAALKASTLRSYQLGSTTSGGVGSTRIFTYSYTRTIPGLGDSTSGVLSGTPTATGTYDVTETVDDTYSKATTSYQIVITAGTVAPKIDHCYQEDSKCTTDDEAFEYSHSSQHEDFYCGSDGDVHGTLHGGDYNQTDVDALNRVMTPTAADITKDLYMIPKWSNSQGSYSTSSYSTCHIKNHHEHIDMENGEIQFSGTHELVIDNDALEIHNQNATMDTKKMTCTYTGGIQVQTPSKQADFHGTSVFVSSGLQIKHGTWDICGPNVGYGTSKAMVFPTTTQVNTVKSREGSTRAPQAPASSVNFDVYKTASLHVAGNANAQNAKFYLEQNPTNPSYISGGLLAAGAHLTTDTKSSFPAPNSQFSSGRVVRINITNKATGVVTSKLVYINDQSGTATPGRQTSTFLGSTK